jgi:tRNA1(Val) A37 N6-methylase TrmN6
VVVFQPRRGYRYGVECYALAAFALDAAPAPTTAVDLGCGGGIVSLLLASVGVRTIGLELDPEWVGLARTSAAACASRVRENVSFQVQDIREPIEGPPVDVAVTNPPWFDPRSGPAAGDPRRAASRTMFAGGCREFVEAGFSVSDRVCVATRVERLGDLRGEGRRLSRIARLGRRVVLVELRRGEGSCVEEALDLPAIYARFRSP